MTKIYCPVCGSEMFGTKCPCCGYDATKAAKFDLFPFSDPFGKNTDPFDDPSALIFTHIVYDDGDKK